MEFKYCPINLLVKLPIQTVKITEYHTVMSTVIIIL